MRHVLASAALVAALFAPRSAAALAIDQIDTFEDGTTQGWVVALLGSPHPAPPANVATGGPAGDGDAFLLLTAVGGVGAGNRLTVINPAQWAGDYTAAGITQIAMDVRNFGETELALRLLFEDPVVGVPSNQAFSTDAIAVPAGGGWTHIAFPVTPAALSAALGTVDAALSGATEIRIFHSTANDYPGESIAAQLGVDNIRAAPEPGGAALAAFAVAALAGLGGSGQLAHQRRFE